MCRHIHDIVTPIAPNVTWVMGAIVARYGGAYTQWYPGDDYVDWHALDVYGYTYGTDEPEASPESGYFVNIIEPDWSEALFLNQNKPVMIVEFGAYKTDKEPDRSQWYKDFFNAAKTTHKELGAFIYWQFPGSGCEIMPGVPCADDWYNEMNGPDSSWWHSSIVTESSK